MELQRLLGMSSVNLVSKALLGTVFPSESVTLPAADVTRVWEFDSLF